MADAGPPPLIGLIVNPIAGLGGPLALKGSDAPDLLAEAARQGAIGQAPLRAGQALATLLAGLNAQPSVIAAAGDMGEQVARAAGLEPRLVPGGSVPDTGAEDTREAARAIAAAGADLLLFAGGDGTARDICAAIGDRLPVVGIPAGVKMQSAVYAVHPRAAGELALRHLQALARDGRGLPLRDLEVMDLDEDAYRAGTVSPRLFGVLRSPHHPGLTQGPKEGRAAGEGAALDAIAAEMADRMTPQRLYILGPGTTTRAIARRLGVEKTLLGVDLLRDGHIVARDADAATLLARAGDEDAWIVVSPIGGQGHILGRGNQQIGPALLRRLGRARLVVVATPAKLASLRARPLRVDTGDPDLDHALAGPIRVITGHGRETVCPVVA